MAAGSVPVHVGCCGFAVAQAQYVRAFSCVEIDTSFYNLPRLETALRWRAQSPPEFVFTLKAWQVITHRATSPTYRRTRLEDSDREYCGHFGFNPTIRWAWDATFQVARELGAALVLFQCPPSFRPTTDNLRRLRAFFERAKRGRWQMGWEPRGDWPADQIAELCRELDLIHVVDPFQQPPALTSRLRYFRLHGQSGARHRYTDDELRQLRGFCAGRPATFCFFNNIAMATDARRFKKLLE